MKFFEWLKKCPLWYKKKVNISFVTGKCVQCGELVTIMIDLDTEFVLSNGNYAYFVCDTVSCPNCGVSEIAFDTKFSLRNPDFNKKIMKESI